MTNNRYGRGKINNADKWKIKIDNRYMGNRMRQGETDGRLIDDS